MNKNRHLIFHRSSPSISKNMGNLAAKRYWLTPSQSKQTRSICCFTVVNLRYHYASLKVSLHILFSGYIAPWRSALPVNIIRNGREPLRYKERSTMPISDMEPIASFGSDTRVDTFRQPPSGDHYTRSDLGHPSGSTGEPE